MSPEGRGCLPGEGVSPGEVGWCLPGRGVSRGGFLPGGVSPGVSGRCFRSVTASWGGSPKGGPRRVEASQGGGPKIEKVGARRWSPEGWEAQNFVFFPSPTTNLFLSSLYGVLSWNFGGVWRTIPWIMAVHHDVARQVLADVDVALRDVQRDMSWIPLVSIGTGLLAAEMLALAEMTLPSRSSQFFFSSVRSATTNKA